MQKNLTDLSQKDLYPTEENGSMRMCYNYIFVVTGSYSTLLAYKTQWYVHKVGQFGTYKATCIAMIFRAPIFLLLQMMSQNWNHYNCSTSQTTEYIQDLPPVTFLDK